MTNDDLVIALVSDALLREFLQSFLNYLHETSALASPPSETWVDAFLESRAPAWR